MLYVYAITADHAGEGTGALPEEGILPGVPVRRFGAGALAAVASAVPDDVFGAEALPRRLEDPAWTRARVLAHERVVAALLPGATVLPLKFCTLFSGEAALMAAIERHRGALDEAAGRLRGCREWGVQLFVEPPAPTPAAAPMPEPALPGAGAAFFRRKRAESEARAVAAAALDLAVAASHRRLAAHARAAIANPVQPPELHGRRGAMVLNGAYLVAGRDEPAWRAALAELERTHADAGMRYLVTGPWAAYHFAGGLLG